MSKVPARYVHAFFLTRCGKMKRLSEEKGEKIKRVSNKVTKPAMLCYLERAFHQSGPPHASKEK